MLGHIPSQTSVSYRKKKHPWLYQKYCYTIGAQAKLVCMLTQLVVVISPSVSCETYHSL